MAISNPYFTKKLKWHSRLYNINKWISHVNYTSIKVVKSIIHYKVFTVSLFFSSSLLRFLEAKATRDT